MSVVPSEETSQHSKDCELECNHVSHTDVTKKNRKSKKGNWRAGKHAIKRSKRGTLVDRGANGGILGNDANVVFKRSKTVDVTGIDNHELSSLRIVDATAKTITDKGPVILILRNCQRAILRPRLLWTPTTRFMPRKFSQLLLARIPTILRSWTTD